MNVLLKKVLGIKSPSREFAKQAMQYNEEWIKIFAGGGNDDNKGRDKEKDVRRK